MSEPISPESQAGLLASQVRDSACEDDAVDAPSTDSHLGLDFGFYSSKLALSRSKNSQIQVFRVQLDVGYQHPESSNNHNEINNMYEFSSTATLVGDKLLTGRQAAVPANTRKQVFHLKTILMYLAGITNKQTLAKAAGGPAVIRAFEEGWINETQMHRALLEHFTLLHDMANKRARILKAKIVTVVLTVPKFLSEREHTLDYRMLRHYYLSLVDIVWGNDDVRFEITTEGQAVALHVCEAFQVEDSDSLFDRARLLNDLQDMVVDGALNLKFFDGGGGTVNVEDVTAYLRPDNTIWSTQSNANCNSVAGALGGSSVSNSEVKDLIEDKLRPGVAPEELAALMRNFEIWKWNIDNLVQTEPVELLGTHRHSWVSLPAHLVTRALEKSFGPGLDALKVEVEQSLEIKRNCAFIFCGGSYRNPAVRRAVDEIFESYKDRTSAAGIKLRLIYLSNYDKTWQSAVSVGAALSVHRVPNPFEVFRGSALGIHQVTKVKGKLKDADCAHTLYSTRWGLAPLVYFEAPRRSSRISREFWLICDPNYTRDAKEKHQDIAIPLDKDALGGPIGPYQLDYMLKSRDLPRGSFVIYVFGPDLEILSDGLNDSCRRPGIVTIGLRCCPVVGGRLMQHHPSAKSWHIGLKTASSTKLLVAARGIRLPVHCDCCGNVAQVVHQCLVCEEFFVCDECWVFANESICHAHGQFDKVNIIDDPLIDDPQQPGSTASQTTSVDSEVAEGSS